MPPEGRHCLNTKRDHTALDEQRRAEDLLTKLTKENVIYLSYCLCYRYESKCHLPFPLSLNTSHQALHSMPFSLSQFSHALFRTKNNPETILLTKEEAI